MGRAYSSAKLLLLDESGHESPPSRSFLERSERKARLGGVSCTAYVLPTEPEPLTFYESVAHIIILNFNLIPFFGQRAVIEINAISGFRIKIVGSLCYFLPIHQHF